MEGVTAEMFLRSLGKYGESYSVFNYVNDEDSINCKHIFIRFIKENDLHNELKIWLNNIIHISFEELINDYNIMTIIDGFLYHLDLRYINLHLRDAWHNFIL